jgi:hypothetical protein
MRRQQTAERLNAHILISHGRSAYFVTAASGLGGLANGGFGDERLDFVDFRVLAAAVDFQLICEIRQAERHGAFHKSQTAQKNFLLCGSQFDMHGIHQVHRKPDCPTASQASVGRP